jgi:G:T-mismatch repair DNA endonuclease (very short patch repair protein)
MFQNPSKIYLSAFNNPKGQKFFKECIPDLYCITDKEAFFFNGCYFHGHYENCKLNRKATSTTINKDGKTYEQLNVEFESKMYDLIQNNNAEVDKVTVIWECNYKEKRKAEYYQKWLKNIFVPHPLLRLKPRSCVRGAYADVYRYKWCKQLTNENMYYVDINGLYSYCALKYLYMTNSCKILMGNDLNLIKIQNNSFFVENKQIQGTMLVTILPPRNLFKPFLLYRTKAGKTVITLCKQCAEADQRICKHSEKQRALTSSYFISEISKALTLGYTLLYIHECHYYIESKFLLHDFVKMLYFHKMRHSDLLQNCITKTEKQNYLNYLNIKMDFKEPNILKLSNIDVNSENQFFFKQMANSFFGKFLQKPSQTQSIFVRTQSQLEDLFTDITYVKSIFSFGEFCQVEIKKNLNKLPPNRNGNCYIGGQITAYAREVIYDYLNVVENSLGTLYYVDCDSIIFTLPKDVEIPLTISHAVGDFKFQIEGEILSFYSFGPKNYTLTYKANDQIKVYTKVKGLSLQAEAFQHELDNNLFTHFLLSNSSQQKEIFQLRSKKMPNGETQQHCQTFTFKNHFTKNRILDKTNFTSYPYGWQFE